MSIHASTPLIPGNLGADLGSLVADLLDRLSDQVADRVLDRLRGESDTSGWLDLAQASEHLGIHADTLRKRAKAGLVPFEQEAPGSRMYFCRADLDAWRRAGGGQACRSRLADRANGLR